MPTDPAYRFALRIADLSGEAGAPEVRRVSVRDDDGTVRETLLALPRKGDG